MLEIQDLHVKFHNRDREAVGGVSLTIHDGEILGLVGESGSGKTVTAMSVAGLLPRKSCDYSGRVLLDGTELLHADRSLLRQVQGRDMGVVFQEPMTAMDPLMKIGRQVEEVLRIHTDKTRQERRALALEALDAVELPEPAEVYEKYPHELSGGMLQRAMIAAAIIHRPKLLLLDEPTTALDVTIQAQILELMKELQKDFGMSILFITHDLGTVARMCDRVAVMYLGKIVETAPAVEIFKNPQHPYTRGLIGSVHKIGTKGQDKLFSIEGTVPVAMNLPKRCGFYDRCDKRIEGVCDKCDPELINSGENHKVACFACTGCPQADKCGAEGGKA